MKSLPLSLMFFLLLFTTSDLLAKTPLHRTNFSATELRDLQGHYSTIYGHFYIRVNGKQVSTRYDGKYIELIKKSDGHFYPRYKFLWVFPINIGNMSFSLKKINSGKIRILMHEKRKIRTVAQKFYPKPIPSAWKHRLGSYQAKKIKGKSGIKKVRLALQQGILVAFINQLKSPYPLLANSNTQLTSPSAGHNHDRTIKISINKNVIVLEYENNKLALKKL